MIYTIAALVGDPMLCQNLADHGTRPASRPCPTIPEQLHCRLRLEFVHGRRRQYQTPSWAAGVGRDGKDMERMKKNGPTEVIRRKRILVGGWEGKMEILVLGPIGED